MGWEPTKSRYERDALIERADELLAASDEPSPGRFHWRRVPGTASLAMTNTIAMFIAIDVDIFARVLILAYIGRFATPRTWGVILGLAALFLWIAVFTRRWTPLNIGSAISLFAWTAISLSIIFAWIAGMAGLSAIALALSFWMVAGQASMLITPLIARGTDSV